MTLNAKKKQKKNCHSVANWIGNYVRAFYIYCCKVGNRSRGQLVGSLFNSYYTDV